MKNPLEKQDDSSLVITCIVAGAVAAGTMVYLYLTESGIKTRAKLSAGLEEHLAPVKHKIKDSAKEAVSGAISKKTGISKKNIKAVADKIVK